MNQPTVVAQDQFRRHRREDPIRQRNRRSQEVCVAFSLVAIIVAIAAPLALTRQTTLLEEMDIQIQVINQELIAIASDSGHSCAIQAFSGKVICWGNQIGVPANLQNVTQIAVGNGFSCALVETKKLVCWGDDMYADFVQPPEGLGEISFLTAAAGAVCVIENGIGRCWGMIDWGRVEITIPSDAGRLRFLAVPKQGNLKRICGIRQVDDIVQCWTTSAGYLFLNNVPLDIQQQQQHTDPVSTPMKSVAVMEDFACAIAKQDSSLHCWTFNDTEYAVPLPQIPSDTTFTAVVAGHDKKLCAIQTSGNPICFGDNGQQLYIPPQIGHVKHLSVDQRYTCAILTNYGSGICWGMDVAPGEMSPLLTNPLYAYQVSAGVQMTCAIHFYEELIDCWGLRRYQVLVDATALSVGDEVVCLVDASDDLAKCVFGSQYFVLLDRKVSQVRVSRNDLICTNGILDRTVRCYRTACKVSNYKDFSDCSALSEFPGNPEEYIAVDGFNQVRDLQIGERHYCVIEQETNRLGCGPLDGPTNVTIPEAQLPEDLAPVRDVALGQFFTCAIQENYEIVCWGDETKYGNEYVLDPPKGSYYQAIAATPNEACAITLDNFVHCWGRPFISSMFVPSRLANVKEITAGTDHFCALMENQDVECWGSNRYGELSKDYFG